MKSNIHNEETEALERIARRALGEDWRERMYAVRSETFGVQPTAKQIAEVRRKVANENHSLERRVRP